MTIDDAADLGHADDVNPRVFGNAGHVDGKRAALCFMAGEGDDKGFVFIYGLAEYVGAAADSAGVGKNVGFATKGDVFTGLECRMVIAELDKLAHRFTQVRVAGIPLVRTTVVRILEAFHADFIAIIDGRYARQGHLK